MLIDADSTVMVTEYKTLNSVWSEVSSFVVFGIMLNCRKYVQRYFHSLFLASIRFIVGNQAQVKPLILTVKIFTVRKSDVVLWWDRLSDTLEKKMVNLLTVCGSYDSSGVEGM